MTPRPARPPAVGFIFVTLILIVLGFGIIIPVLPGLVTEFAGGKTAEGAHSFGWLVGSFALMQFIAAPILGALSDRFGRRKVILIALAGSAIDYVVMGLAPSLGWLFVARIIAGLTAGALATCNAYVADVTPPEKRAQAFGLVGAAFGIGFVLGPSIGGLLGNVNLRLPFFVAAGCVSLNWLYGALVLPESLPPEKRRAFEWKRANPIGALLNLRRFPGIVGFAGMHFLYMLGHTMLQTTWVLYTTYRYGWTPRQVGFSLMLVGVTSAIVQGRLVGPILRRLGEQAGLKLGLLLSAVVFVLYGFATEGWMIYVLVCLGGFAGIAGPATQALITRRVPTDEQGTVQGALGSLASLASVFAPPVGAWSFAACIAPESRFQLPGIAFFEAAFLCLIALGLAARTIRADAVQPSPRGDERRRIAFRCRSSGSHSAPAFSSQQHSSTPLMLPYALSIFTGAFLLFQVQPLIGKYILPWFGGGPGVWTTCLLFFQTVLLGGYAYAHFSSTRLRPQRQAMLHLGLLALALALLPITPSDGWKSSVAGNPTWQILFLLTATIGLPYFVLSATGPLMQQWFSYTNPGVSPYRLYALSNVGSLLALLSYPIFFEVRFPRHTQGTMWSVGLVLFALCCGFCALRVWRHGRGAPSPVLTPLPEPDAPSLAPSTGEVDLSGAVAAPSAVDKLFWLSLPAIASILLLATTNKLCQEVAVIPFLWVLPLSLYLLSFIICFDHARWYHRGVFAALTVIGVAVVFQLLPVGNDAPMRIQIIGYTGALFIACMVCHGELYQLKPAPRYLTSYFLYISAGGALGGFLVAVVAPALFNDYRELQIGLWVLSYALGALCLRHQSRALALGAGCGAILLTVLLPLLRKTFDDSPGFRGELVAFGRGHAPWIIGGLVILAVCVIDFGRRRLLAQYQPRMAGFLMVLCVALGAVVVTQWPHKGSTPVLTASRNFYGTLKVFDYYPTDEEDHYHLLLHGATTHGFQFVKPERSIIATTYYGESSGVGRALDHLPAKPRRIGLVGLGTGSLAVYGQPGDTLRIYEINPAVEQLARTQFSYLENCRAKVTVVMGDARLMMEQELARNESQQFDLLALDAFSSDAIPVHLLTKEAFDLYLRQIKPDGIIAVHVSNRYLNLRPVVEKLAQNFGLGTAVIYDDNDPNWWIYATTWILVTKNKEFLSQSAILDVTEEPETNKRPAPLWTDDFASVYSIMK